MKALGRFFYAAALISLLLALAFLVYGTLRNSAVIAQEYARQSGERALIESRRDAYALTATAFATPQAESRFDTGAQWVSLNMDVAQFATNTPRPPQDDNAGQGGSLFATNTPAASTEAVPTEQAPPASTAAPQFIDMTPGPLPTILYLGEPSEAERAAAPTAIPTAFPIVPRDYDLINILLMGQDNEITGESIARTDTMLVVSINRDTGTVSMLSLPRDLYVYMPVTGMNRLNVTYGVGGNLGWNGGAFFYMRQVLLYNLGINVHYYAMVDLSGFASLIDRIGGIDIAVDCPIQDYPLIGAEVPADAIKTTEDGKYTLGVGYYHLSGAEALWYARSRGNSDDFDRGRRQQQILRAAAKQVLSSGLLNDVAGLPGLINEGLQAVETDLTFNDILGLVPVGLSLDPDQIENFRLIRTYHTTPWQPPDGAFVQLPVADPLYNLMLDFYTPPTPNQLELRAARIRVLNGTDNANWDRVAAERLGWSNLGAGAAGSADKSDYPSTVIIDYTGQDKGSVLPFIVEALNAKPENVIAQPDPNREVDFDVIVGADYNSCTGFVLDPEQDGE